MAFSLSLGSVVVYLKANVTQYNTAMAGAVKTLNRTSRRLTSMGTKMSLRATLPLMLLGRAAVKEFASFDDAMTQSIAIMKDVTPEIRKQMEEIAKSIALRSITAPTMLAKSYFFLTSAGLNVAQSLKAIGVVERFAVAGMFDMAEATTLLMDSQSALGLRFADTTKNMKQAIRVSDVLVRANTLANATVEQFATSLTHKAGAAMKAYNIELEEGVAMLAAYAEQGIKGELAGNMFGRMLRLLIKAIITNESAFRKLGIRTKDAKDDLVPLADIIEDITQVTSTMGAVQRAATLRMLGFQARSQQAILPLIGMADKIRIYQKELDKAGGITDKVAKKQLTSFTSQMKIMWNHVRIVAIELKSVLGPALLWVNAKVKIGVALWRSLDESTKRWVVGILAAVAAVGPLLVMLGIFTASLSAIAGFLAFMITPVGLAMIGIIALVVAIGLLVYSIVGPEGLKSAWKTGWEATKNFLKNTIGFLANLTANFKILFGWLSRNWQNILKDMVMLWITAWKNQLSNLGVILKTMMRLFVAFQGWLLNMWDRLFKGDFNDAIIKGLVKAGNTILSWVKKMASLKLNILKMILTGGAKGLKAADDAVIAIGEQLMKDLGKGLSEVDFLKTAKEILKEGIGELKGPLDGFISSIEALPEFKYDTDVFERIKKIVDKIKDAMEKTTEEATELATGLGTKALAGGEFRQVSLRRISLEQPALSRGRKQQVQDDLVAGKLDEIKDLLSDAKEAAVTVLR